jgi:hypothetical protein
MRHVLEEAQFIDIYSSKINKFFNFITFAAHLKGVISFIDELA